MFFLVLGGGNTFRVKLTRLYSRYGTLPKGARIGAYLESLRASGMTPEPISDESGSNPRFSLVDTFILRTFSILIGAYIYLENILYFHWLNPES